MIPKSIPEMVMHNCKTFSDRAVFHVKKNGKYRSFTYSWLEQEIKKAASALIQLGIQNQDKVAILSENRIEWPIIDVATMGIGGVVVPIYPTLTPKQIQYILHDSESKVIFVSNSYQRDKILQIKNECPNIQYIISLDPVSGDEVLSWEDLLSKASNFLRENPSFFEKKVKELDPEQTTTIVYTSGTTGNPKGVMLHQKGFMHDIVSAESVLGLQKEDIFLSFLPLSHLYERIAGHYCPIWKGASIAYAESIESVPQNILEIKPTVIVAVPRFYEKMVNKIEEGIQASPKIVQILAKSSMSFGALYHSITNSFLKLVLKPIYNLFYNLSYRKILQKLGGRIRYLISGGAPLPSFILQFFESIGLPIIEGYGMTETHLIITLTPYGKHKYGSCGKPIPGVEIKISEEGEILVKGPTIMKGYYHLPEETQNSISADGWFHTGDLGYMDEEGYVFITGRKKHIIITSGGKNIAPQPVEDALKQSPYIHDVVMIGNGRKFPVALIVPEMEELISFAQSKNIDYRQVKDLLHHPLIKELYYQELEDKQKGLARYEKAKHYILIPEAPSIENGLLTPSLKIKREKLEQKYIHEINSLYERFK